MTRCCHNESYIHIKSIYTMNPKLALNNLLSNLISRAPRSVDTGSDTPSPPKGTTIRFEHDVRRFIDVQAEHLGISVQEFVRMTLKAVMKATVEPQSSELQLMAERFLRAYVAHNIAIADIPLLLPDKGLQRSDLLSTETLINKLNPEIIEHTANLFFVETDWLKGRSDKPHSTSGKTWYKNKNLQVFARKLAEYNYKHGAPHVLFIAQKGVSLAQLKEAMDREDSVDPIPIRVVLELPRSENGVDFTTYEIWNAERWNYKPCRHHLKSIMLFCERTRLHYDGVLLPEDTMDSLVHGELGASCLNRHRSLWYPDQLLWNDDRNPEQAELPTLHSFYDDQELTTYEIAIKQPWRIESWHDALSGGITIKPND